MGIEQDANEFLTQSNTEVSTEQAPTSSIESDANEFLSKNQESNQVPSATQGLESQFGGSPLSFVQRAALSFAGDNKENVLKRDFKFVEKLPNGKFAVGNDIRSLQPIDPDGVFNDMLGDIADVANWVAPMLASTTAAIAAAPADVATASPLPSMLAAGRGMAIGETFNKTMGGALGVGSETPKKMASDIGLAGASGFAGQGLGLGAAKILESSVPVLAHLMDKLRGNLPETVKNGFDVGMKKILHVAAAVDEKATEIGLRVGFRNLLSQKNMSSGEITNITRDVIKNTAETESRLGGLVDDAVMKLHSVTSGKPVIEAKQPFQVMTQGLKDIGLLHEGNFINKNYPNQADKSFFQKFFAELGARKQVKNIPIEDTFSRNVKRESILRYVSPEEKLPFKSLVTLKREFASEYDKLSPRAQMVYSEFMGSLNKEANAVATQAGDTSFAEANRGFSDFMSTRSTLKQAGLDTNSPISTNNFLSKIIDHPDIVQGELSKLDSMIGGNLVDRASQWNAAQKFKVANPGMLRLSMISGILGGSIGGGDTNERLGRGALFATLGLGGLPQALRIGESLGSMVTQAKTAKMTALLKSMQPLISAGGAYSAKENYSNGDQNQQQ